MEKKIVPHSASDSEGNTRPQKSHTPLQSNACKKWFFTFNNYTDEDISKIVPRFNEICDKYAFQEELGSEGTKHLQGNIWLKHKMRFTEFKLNNKIHWEKTKDEEAALAYVTKSESRNGLQWIYGFPKPIKIISELRPWQKTIEDIFFDEPDGRTVHWFWEPIGKTGKSQFCKYMYVKHGAITIQGGKLADIMNIIFNIDMDKTTMILIDIPRNTGNKISYSAVECILNGMITNTKYETGIKVFNPPHLICLANCEPQFDMLSEDRWKVTKI